MTTKLTTKNLAEADLFQADLTRADLTWADLRGALLQEADLTWANLRGADLTGAHLARADLTGADLTGATLTDAQVDGTDLTGSIVRDVDLSTVDLSTATEPGLLVADETTTLPNGWELVDGHVGFIDLSRESAVAIEVARDENGEWQCLAYTGWDPARPFHVEDNAGTAQSIDGIGAWIADDDRVDTATVSRDLGLDLSWTTDAPDSEWYGIATR